MKPFYQGKLDVFCAIYAVLNGLRLTHNIHTIKGRDILNDTLYDLALDHVKFREFLDQKTDYVFLVDNMLEMLAKKYPLEIIKPFTVENLPNIDTFWNKCELWLNNGEEKYENRAIICRFCRYLNIDKSPIVKHWTTINSINGNVLYLFDSSHEAESIRNLKKENIVVSAKDLTKDRLIYIQPDTMHMIRMPF